MATPATRSGMMAFLTIMKTTTICTHVLMAVRKINSQRKKGNQIDLLFTIITKLLEYRVQKKLLYSNVLNASSTVYHYCNVSLISGVAN